MSTDDPTPHAPADTASGEPPASAANIRYVLGVVLRALQARPDLSVLDIVQIHAALDIAHSLLHQQAGAYDRDHGHRTGYTAALMLHTVQALCAHVTMLHSVSDADRQALHDVAAALLSAINQIPAPDRGNQPGADHGQ